MAETDQDNGGTPLKKWKFYNNGRTWKFSCGQDESACIDTSTSQIPDFENNVSDQKLWQPMSIFAETSGNKDDEEEVSPFSESISQPERTSTADEHSALYMEVQQLSRPPDLQYGNQDPMKCSNSPLVSPIPKSKKQHLEKRQKEGGGDATSQWQNEISDGFDRLLELAVEVDRKRENSPVNASPKTLDSPKTQDVSNLDNKELNENDDEGLSSSQVGQHVSKFHQKLLTELNCQRASTSQSELGSQQLKLDQHSDETSQIDKGDGASVSSLVPYENIFEGLLSSNMCTLNCRSVRVGSYKVVPKDRIVITEKGVQIKVPAIMNNMEIVTITIPMSYVLKVLAHFGKSMPLLFLYISPSACKRARASLSMNSNQSFFIDIISGDETQKRVTILPEKLTDENKILLKRHFGTTLQEVESKEANEILVRSSPKDLHVLKQKMASANGSVVKKEEEAAVVKNLYQQILDEDDCQGKMNSVQQLGVIDLTEISDDEENTCEDNKRDVEIIDTVDNIQVIASVNNTKTVDGACQVKKAKSEVQQSDGEVKEDDCDEEKDTEEDSLQMDMTADISDIVDLSVDTNSQSNFDEATKQVMSVLPNVDPNYIQKKVIWVTQRFPDRQVDPTIILNGLLEELEQSSLPQKRLNTQEIKDMDVVKASKMTASDFLEKYADPHSHFSSIHANVSDTYKMQAVYHLSRLYSVHGEAVQKILESNNFHLFPTVLMLENRDPGHGKQPQQNLPDRPEGVDPIFVEEVVYCRLACYVRQRQKKLKNIRKKKIIASQSRGEMLPECSKCDKDCLNEEVIQCKKNHSTCRTCIMNAVQKQETYEGMVRCQCGEVLSSTLLKELLPSRMIDQLERQFTNQCPLCNGPGLQKSRNVFVCAVAECGKEICKLCWKENHPNRNCGDKQAIDQGENDMFSLIGLWDTLTKEGDGQVFYRKKLETTGRRKINSTNKFDNLYRLAEGHYLKMLARDTYALNAQMGPIGVNNNNFCNNIPKCIEIVANKELEKKFKSQKDEFKNKGLPHDEILAFHGTNQLSADSILLNNFRMDNVRHGQVHGRGVYLSEFPNFARRYGNVLLLCRVLPGHEYVGPQLGVPQGWNSKKVRPSTDEYGEQILVDNVDQILPVFVIYINSSTATNPQQPNLGALRPVPIKTLNQTNFKPPKYGPTPTNPLQVSQQPAHNNSNTNTMQNNAYLQMQTNPPPAHQNGYPFQLTNFQKQPLYVAQTNNTFIQGLCKKYYIPPSSVNFGLGSSQTSSTTIKGTSTPTPSPSQPLPIAHTPPSANTEPACKKTKLN